MGDGKELEVVVRPKRQVTLPREVCDRLGIEPGDMLEISVEGSALLAKPKKAIALEALGEIREAFRSSGITEAELQKAGRRARREAVTERHAAEA